MSLSNLQVDGRPANWQSRGMSIAGFQAGACSRSETATATAEPAPEPSNKHWYVVKVQSGREESIKDAIERLLSSEK